VRKLFIYLVRHISLVASVYLSLPTIFVREAVALSCLIVSGQTT